MKHLFARLLVPALSVFSTAASAQAIDNLSNWNGISGIGTFGTGGGNSSANTFGQSFVAPAQSFLASWETAFRAYPSNPFRYRFYIAPWDAANARLAGSPVFTSGDLTSPTYGAGYVSLKVTTNVALTPGMTYMAFTSTSAFNPQPDSGGVAQAGYFDHDAYAGGGWYKNDGSSLAAMEAGSGWDARYAGWDTAFLAEFQAVPEPTTVVALGVGALVLARRRR